MENSHLNTHHTYTFIGKWILLVLVFTTCGMIPVTVFAQDDTEEETPTSIKSRMSLSVNQFSDRTIELTGLLRAKIEGRYQQIPDAALVFFALHADGEEQRIGEGTTNAGGTASVILNHTDMSPDADSMFSFLVRFDGNDFLSGSEADIQLIPAILEMNPLEQDSSYILQLKATALTPDGEQAIAGVPVSVYVKRMFSALEVASGETDEEGKLEVEFPNDLNGDDHSNLTITALIADTDEYGSLKATMVQPWGRPVSYEVENLPKALWSPHPPTWMIVTFFILMGTVWGHYIIIIFNLFGIKSEKQTDH